MPSVTNRPIIAPSLRAADFTPVGAIIHLTDLVDFLMVMTVNPGLTASLG